MPIDETIEDLDNELSCCANLCELACIEVGEDDGASLGNAHPLDAYEIYMERDRVETLKTCSEDVEQMNQLNETYKDGCKNSLYYTDKLSLLCCYAMENATEDIYMMIDYTVTCADKSDGSCCEDPMNENHRYNDCDIRGDYAGDPYSCCLNITSNISNSYEVDVTFDESLIDME